MPRRLSPRRLRIWASIFLLLAGCSSGPKVTIYTSDPAAKGMEFYNQRTNAKGFVLYDSTDHFFCLESPDLTSLLNFCKANQKTSVLSLDAILASGPLLKVYLSDPTIGGMDFYDEKTGKSGFVYYSDTDKFICLDQVDTQTLLNYCGIKQPQEEEELLKKELLL